MHRPQKWVCQNTNATAARRIALGELSFKIARWSCTIVLLLLLAAVEVSKNNEHVSQAHPRQLSDTARREVCELAYAGIQPEILSRTMTEAGQDVLAFVPADEMKRFFKPSRAYESQISII